MIEEIRIVKGQRKSISGKCGGFTGDSPDKYYMTVLYFEEKEKRGGELNIELSDKLDKNIFKIAEEEIKIVRERFNKIKENEHANGKVYERTDE